MRPTFAHPPAYPGWLDPQEAARHLAALGDRTTLDTPLLLTHHLAPADIVLDAAFDTLAELFALVGRHAGHQGKHPSSAPWRTTSPPNPAQITAALTRRENLGATRLHPGTHLPHARLPGLPAPRLLYLRRGANVAADIAANPPHPANTPTQALVLLVPYPATPDHLLLLAAAHRQLASLSVAERLARAGGKEEVWAVLIG